MNDLEIVRACAAAMGLRAESLLEDDPWPLYLPDETDAPNYDPLHDDAQAMALVKRFGLSVFHTESGWSAGTGWGVEVETVTDRDLNYAVCRAVAALQSSKPESAK